MNVNKVMLVGRLTRDPEVRTTGGGQSVTSISLATGRTYTDKAGQRQESTEYHSIVLWGKLAEIAGQYLVKGQECYIEGRLQTRSYTAKDGSERKVTEIVGESMQMGNKPGGQTAGNYQSKSTTASGVGARPVEKEEEIPTINLDDELDEIRLEDVPF